MFELSKSDYAPAYEHGFNVLGQRCAHSKQDVDAERADEHYSTAIVLR